MNNNPYRPATTDPAANAPAGPGSRRQPGPVTPSILLMSGVCGLIGLLLAGYIAWQLRQ